jgi:carbon monoxide dehydrogenase subunit G
MRIEGSQKIALPRETVWRGLLDPRILARSLPGCKQLEPNADGGFRAEMVVGVGPVKGIFHGHVQILDAVPPDHYRMKVEGKGPGGFVNGEGTFELTDDEASGTVIHYAADAQVGGMIASVGQRLLHGSALKVVHQFFAAFAAQLQPEGALAADAVAAVAAEDTATPGGAASPALTPPEPSAPVTFPEPEAVATPPAAVAPAASADELISEDLAAFAGAKEGGTEPGAARSLPSTAATETASDAGTGGIPPKH